MPLPTTAPAMATPPRVATLARLLVLLAVVVSNNGGVATALPIGVNYGANGNNLPAPSAVASFLATKTSINRVKLFDANPAFISAFASAAPSVSLAVTVPNAALPSFANKATGLAAARGWVRDNLAGPSTRGANVTLLLAGNEVLGPFVVPSISVALLPAMRRLHQALRLEGLRRVRVTTPHFLGILAPSPTGFPSAARFRYGLERKVLVPMLRFLNRTSSPLMVNAYPYFSYNPATLNYAVFRPNPGVRDPGTNLVYTSMFAAQMDALYTAMKKVGFGNVPIAVGEAGWPTQAEPGQAGVSVRDARDFNAGMIQVCSGGKGTPLMPGRTFEAYIFALFDENQKPGPIAERNFGIFDADFTPKYDLGLLRQGAVPAAKPIPNNPGGGAGWCVARAGADAAVLQNNINYACGAGVDCRPIQSGGACFVPNNVQSHASYVMNAYYKANGRQAGACDFKGTGVVTATNPSYGSCKFV